MANWQNGASLDVLGDNSAMPISEATLKDSPQLCELLGELSLPEVAFKPDYPRQAEGLRQIISNPEVGRILVLRSGEKAIATARSLGYRRVTLLADGANGDAHRFYVRHGFTLAEMVPFRMIFELDIALPALPVGEGNLTWSG
jgi:GNAT superfamily N-acetyltransferase